MTPEITHAFDLLRSAHGARSIERVEQMLDPRRQTRDPFQKNAKWVMPGISRRAWHDPYAYSELLPIVEALEAHHGAIKAEYAAAWSARSARLESYDHYLVRRPDWKALYLFRRGAPVPEVAAEVPTTFRLVDELAIRSGKLCPLLESHFSTLLPGASIPPHCDLWNFSINLHFAVDIPSDCGIRVGSETRTWEEGRCLLFDYSFEHEAWNKSPRARSCLLLDLWHPEVTLPEREALVVLIREVRKLLGEG